MQPASRSLTAGAPTCTAPGLLCFPLGKFGLFWDSYSPAVALLLARETGGQEYRAHWQGFLDAWTSLKGNEHVVTSPKGWVPGVWASATRRPRGGVWRSLPCNARRVVGRVRMLLR